MSALLGIRPIGNYAAAGNDTNAVNILLALIPDPDSTAIGGATAGGGMLDQMSPACCAQLRVELIALRAAVATVNSL